MRILELMSGHLVSTWKQYHTCEYNKEKTTVNEQWAERNRVHFDLALQGWQEWTHKKVQYSENLKGL